MTRLTRVKDDGGAWETEVDTGGGGGSVTPPVTLTGTDPSEVVLTLEADDAQTEHIFRVYNVDGDLSVDIDNNGILDTKRIAVQDPPDTGGGASASGVQLRPDQITVSSGVDASLDPVIVRRYDAGSSGFFEVFRVGLSGAVCKLSPPGSDTVAMLEMGASVSGTGNAIELWDQPFNNLLFAVTYTGGVIFPSSDPLVAGAWWDNAGTLTRSAG